MNISIKAAKTKKKKSLGLGLNQRGAKGNVLGGESSSDDEGDASDSSRTGANDRSSVNQAIAREQQALRKRAQEAAAAATEDSNVYDYDGAYDSFQLKPSGNASSSKNDDSKKSRYIRDLLKAAGNRQREQELRIERKVASEQAEEDAQADYRGKEKFVTAAYKRKLQERQLWQEQEDKKAREEEVNDVSRRGGTAMASFYGNLNKNVAFGGREEPAVDPAANNEASGRDSKANDASEASPRRSFLEGFERSGGDDGPQEDRAPATMTTEDASSPELSKRQIRERKVAEARIRYLERRRAVEAS